MKRSPEGDKKGYRTYLYFCGTSMVRGAGSNPKRVTFTKRKKRRNNCIKT
jgi:hypothetical protein